ncbi:TRAP transporter substrate-binding protein [Nereida sp. MMG025]|uniref:TRAP transporter substrate-binding protein n=1 Tax=Nereida sp. MMG025 TaxID=2909981 RepID=UPI001F3B397F|nr:TRAP transporter substrate-binding protein [Nereida sp. MMG025]MCF6443543.1 TRAP transporter substrate-binding protein [Nereida sp. MMG025]
MKFTTFTAAAVATVMGTTAFAQDITLRYAIQNPESHVSAKAAMEFDRVLREETDGEMGIQLFAGGQLGGVKDVIQSVQLGAIDMTIVRPGHVADLGATEFNALSMPYIFSDDEHQDAVLFGDVGERILATLESIDIKGVGFYRDLPRHFFFTDTAVTEIADMEGLKLRSLTSELAVDTIAAVGAAPTPMPFSELYGALQSGVVDGGDQPITGFAAQRYQEVAKHIILDGHDASPLIVLMSKRTWDGLNEAQQAAVMTAQDAAANIFVQINDESVGALTEELTAAGVTIVPVEDKTPWQEATAHLIDEYGADFPDLIEAIRAAD